MRNAQTKSGKIGEIVNFKKLDKVHYFKPPNGV